MREFVISPNDAGQRLDKFVSKAVPRLPQSLMYKAIRNKRIKLNGKRADISVRLNVGDVVCMYINDEFFDVSPENEFMSVPSGLSIIYEDDNIILIDKKNGMVVHEDNENTIDTLINRLKRYLYDKGEYYPEKENSFAPALCNRLDRNTGGIVIAAKNAEALRVINQKIKDRELDKYYLCIVSGRPPEDHGTITAYIEKNASGNTVKVSSEKTAGGKTAITEYTVLKTSGELSLLEIRLHTGRTHQIRAHMAYIGCPILGDVKYGRNRVNKKYNVKTQALYSYKLRFSFRTDGGILAYLDGKEFEVKNVWFLDKFI